MQRFSVFYWTVRFALFGSVDPGEPRYFGMRDIKLLNLIFGYNECTHVLGVSHNCLGPRGWVLLSVSLHNHATTNQNFTDFPKNQSALWMQTLEIHVRRSKTFPVARSWRVNKKRRKENLKRHRHLTNPLYGNILASAWSMMKKEKRSSANKARCASIDLRRSPTPQVTHLTCWATCAVITRL